MRKFEVSGDMHEPRIYTEKDIKDLAYYYWNNSDSSKDFDKMSIDEMIQFIRRVDNVKEVGK